MSAKGHTDAPGSTAGCPLGTVPRLGIKTGGPGESFGDELCAVGLLLELPPRSINSPVPRPG
jgi:hypothetical protein